MRDSIYFLGSIVFKVEDTLFQVPRYHFDSNEVFSTTFSLPPPAGNDAEGSAESNPFELKGVAKADFQAFLKVLYPLTIPHSYKDITLDEWKSILLLSSMWEFQKIRKLAIDILTKSSTAVLKPADKVFLGRKFDVYDWLLHGLIEMVQGNTGPRPEDVNLLGVDICVQIWDLREECIRIQMRGNVFSFEDKVLEVFKAVFKEVTPPPPPSSLLLAAFLRNSLGAGY
ncbi:hypothetical protein CPC08DRAFT_709875, partial [Agrocybe pediades]